MNLLNRKQAKYALGVMGLGAILLGLFKIYRRIKHRPLSLESQNSKNTQQQKSTITQDDNYEHLPYYQLIQDSHRAKMGKGQTKNLDNISDINYRIILCLLKGNSYQGVVNINFNLDSFGDDTDNFPINFSGSGVKYVMVNGIQMDYRDVKYIDQKILIPKQLVKEHSKNSIEIIFENNYSFVNNGMSSYFVMDDSHKYSLRQQVIYSLSGYLQIQKIIPCLNCLNECMVQVEVIHTDVFEVFSNTSKCVQRLCSVAEYHKYPFLFDNSSNSLSRMFKLNNSVLSNGSVQNVQSQRSNNTTSYCCMKKANTNFYPIVLSSIHQLFIFSSAMIELQPTTVSTDLQEVLIRYFCKQAEANRLVKGVSKIHNYIMDIFRRLKADNISEYLNKIDILVIKDLQVEGYFAPGVIILNEETLNDTSVSMDCLYLIVRAIVGMVELSKGNNLITLQQILQLNQTVFSRFQQFRNFLFLKNEEYDNIKAMINDPNQLEYLTKQEGYFLKYYSKQLRYVIKGPISSKISFQLTNLMASFSPDTIEEFWQNFLSNYNFLSRLIAEPLTQLAIKKLSVPTNRKLLDQLQLCFSSSKYLLSFYTNQQIESSLPKFIDREFYGLQGRLTQLKVKQKFRESVTDSKYQKYLFIKSNIEDAEAIYNQFKKFNEIRNIHHISLLQNEIERLVWLGKDFIKPVRIGIDCSLAGWKMLRTLKIYPQDEDYYRLIKSIDKIDEGV